MIRPRPGLKPRKRNTGWNGLAQENPKLWKAINNYWDETHPALMAQLKEKYPEVHEAVHDASWDRQTAALILMLRGKLGADNVIIEAPRIKIKPRPKPR